MTPIAGPLRRLVAYAIDGALWLGLFIVWIEVLVPVSGDLVETLTILALLNGWLNYHALCEWRWGRTLGKRMLGVRVVRTDGSQISPNRAVARNLVRPVDSLVGIFFMMASLRRRRIGDLIAGTMVVRDTGRQEWPATLQPVIGRQPPELSPEAPVDGREPPGRRGTPRVPWTPLAPLLAVAPLLLLLIPAAIGGDSGDEDISMATAIVAQVMLTLYLFGTAFGVAAVRGEGRPLSLLGYRRTSLMQLGAPAAAMGFYISFAIAWNIIVTALGLDAKQEDVTQELGSDSGTAGLVISGILIVGVAPLVEEAFFRGFLFGGFRGAMRFWPAAIASGLIFGSIHFTGGDSIGIVPQLAVFGIALAWVYERTRSIWQCVFLHALNNSVAFAVLASEAHLHARL